LEVSKEGQGVHRKEAMLLEFEECKMWWVVQACNLLPHKFFLPHTLGTIDPQLPTASCILCIFDSEERKQRFGVFRTIFKVKKNISSALTTPRAPPAFPYAEYRAPLVSNLFSFFMRPPEL
jgi:hypothetical protein